MMKAIYPKYLQKKTSIFGLELYDLFVIGAILLISSGRLLNLGFIQLISILTTYILTKVVLSRFPKNHFSLAVSGALMGGFLHYRNKRRSK